MSQELGMPLEGQGLTFGYGGDVVLQSLNVTFPCRQITTILGPNGCGKSTLLQTLARVLKPQQGCVLLQGHDIHLTPTRKVAQQLAMLPQRAHAPAEMCVRDLVAFGRFPHRGFLGRPQPKDDGVIDEALRAVQMKALEDRPMHALSGGEQQRVWLAMALAQQTPWLLLDEPTTSLDVAHRLEILELVAHLKREYSKSVVMVLHDVDLAARYSDHLVFMRSGSLCAQGTAQETITPEVFREVFGVEGYVQQDSRLGVPLFVPLRSTRSAQKEAIEKAT